MSYYRYINTNYAFASSIVNDLNLGIHQLLITYNIGCQWGINLCNCLSTYLPPLNIDLNKVSCIAVPKLHLVGHGASCQGPYNLALMDGVGLTHGEGVETVWSHLTSLATWSRENGPAACHQVLDDHWGSWCEDLFLISSTTRSFSSLSPVPPPPDLNMSLNCSPCNPFILCLSLP